MIHIGEIRTERPEKCETELRQKVYDTLDKMGIHYERVDTDEVITMDDCAAVNEKLHMDMVKTLFVCNRQQTEFYLFITKGDKPFRSKEFSGALGISRVSFALWRRWRKSLELKWGRLQCLVHCLKVQRMYILYLTERLRRVSGMAAVMA